MEVLRTKITLACTDCKQRNYNTMKDKKVHMVTVSGLLETSHRIPNLDYHDLMKLTYILTKDSSQMEEMYRRMCFNVFSHNRDDH